MDRKIPLWFFLLCILFGAAGAVAFGWAVRSRLTDTYSTGIWGDIAVSIATFPATADTVIRQLYEYDPDGLNDKNLRTPRESVDLKRFHSISSRTGQELPGLLVSQEEGLAENAWRLLVGAFLIDSQVRNAALLLSPSVEIVRVWLLSEVPVDGFKPRTMDRKFIHGIAVLDDASLIFCFDGGVTLQRVDACGRRKWVIGGHFNHVVSLDESGESVWAIGTNQRPMRIDVEDGRVLQSFSMQDVISANPEIDILELRRFHKNDLSGNGRNTPGTWSQDRTHLNDVEPLSPSIADEFPEFEAGDLLMSARSLNLIFVLDPSSLEVKWWRIGATQRQHDPDWQPNGEITVYNNRMSRDYSEIVAIDPSTLVKRVIYDGRTGNFYSRIRGKHEVLLSGTIVVTSPQQGRAFEVDPNGKIVFEILNTKPGTGDTNYVISEMRRVSPKVAGAALRPCD